MACKCSKLNKLDYICLLIVIVVFVRCGEPQVNKPVVVLETCFRYSLNQIELDGLL